MAGGAPINGDRGVNNNERVDDGGGPSDGRNEGHPTAGGVSVGGDRDGEDDEVEEDEEAVLDAMMAADGEGHGDFYDDYDEMEGGCGSNGSGGPGDNDDDDDDDGDGDGDDDDDDDDGVDDDEA